MASDERAGDDVTYLCFAVRPIPTDGTPDTDDHILCCLPQGHDGDHANSRYQWASRGGGRTTDAPTAPASQSGNALSGATEPTPEVSHDECSRGTRMTGADTKAQNTTLGPDKSVTK